MADEKKVPRITVKGTGFNNPRLKGRVALWERHDAHPPTLDKDGHDTGRPHEAFVVHDDKEVEVAETAEVKRLIGEGILERPKVGVRTAETPAKREPA